MFASHVAIPTVAALPSSNVAFGSGTAFFFAAPAGTCAAITSRVTAITTANHFMRRMRITSPSSNCAIRAP